MIIRKFIFLVLPVILINCSCADKNIRKYRVIDVNIPSSIILDRIDLKKVSNTLKTDSLSKYTVKITVYSYSSGREVISFSGSGDLTSGTQPGVLKGLIKILEGDKIIRVEFIEAKGNSNEELVSDFNAAILKILQE